MKKRLSVCSLPAWLLVVLSVSSTATTDSLNASLNQNLTEATNTTCSLNITNFSETQEQFENFRTVQTARIINILISGIEWSSFKNESLEVFDPNWWVWTTDDISPLLNVPVDYTILTFGLSRLAFMDLKVEFVSSPAGCERGLNFEQEIQIAMESILQLMGEAQGNDGFICRSVSTQDSVLVRKICCSRKEILTPASHKRGRYCHGDREPIASSKVYGNIFPTKIAKFVLPGFLLLISHSWLLEFYSRVSSDETIVERLVKTRAKRAYFSLGGKNSEMTKMAGGTIFVEKKELIRYKWSVNIADLALKHGVRSAKCTKIKLTLLFILQSIIVAFWLGCYSCMHETLKRFDSTKKILSNLFNNPYSWIFTDSSLGPFWFGCALLIFHILVAIQATVWCLLEIQACWEFFVKCLGLRGYQPLGTLGERVKYLRFLLRASYVVLIISNYVFIFCLVDSITAVTFCVVGTADILASWITGGLLILYYSYRSYTEVLDTYTEIKQLVFQICRDKYALRAIGVGKREMVVLDYREKSITDITGSGSFKFESKTFPGRGPIWFVRKDSAVDLCRALGGDLCRICCRHSRCTDDETESIMNENNAQSNDISTVEMEVCVPSWAAARVRKLREDERFIINAMISRDMFHEVCRRIRPIHRRVRKAILKFFSIFLFLVLVMLTAATFTYNTRKAETSGVMKALMTLLAASMPKLIEMMSETDTTRRLKEACLKFKIEEILAISSSKVMVRVENVSETTTLEGNTALGSGEGTGGGTHGEGDEGRRSEETGTGACTLSHQDMNVELLEVPTVI